MSALRGSGPAVKTVTFACAHFMVAFSIAYLLTGRIGISGLLALGIFAAAQMLLTGRYRRPRETAQPHPISQ